ncbi:hypothetical protein APB40_16435, partial [Pseudomonas aeruginosa]
RTTAAGVRLLEWTQIQPVDHFHDEARQVIFRQPLFYRRWKQVKGLAINRAEAAHAKYRDIEVRDYDSS